MSHLPSSIGSRGEASSSYLHTAPSTKGYASASFPRDIPFSKERASPEQEALAFSLVLVPFSTNMRTRMPANPAPRSWFLSTAARSSPVRAQVRKKYVQG